MDPLDDLLIKRRRGALTGADGRRLDIARRASREYELAELAQDVFDRDGAPALGDAERLRQLVEAIDRRLPASARAPGRSGFVLRRVAPALLFAGAAAASVGELLAPAPFSAVTAAPPHEPPVATSAPRPAQRPAPVPPQPLPIVTPAAEAAPAEPQRAPERVGTRASARPPSANPAPPRRPSLEPTPLVTPHAAEPLPPSESAASLFRRANRLRSVDWPSAAALYVELIRRYPSSNEAGVSEVALGKWSLDRGRSGDALEWFRAHQRRAPGALTAEALFGEARALESVGSHSEALGPWRRLLELYPASPYADVARRRLLP